MEYTNKEKIIALINYVESIDEIKKRLSKINILMNIFTFEESFKLKSKLYDVREDITSVIDRLKQTEKVKK